MKKMILFSFLFLFSFVLSGKTIFGEAISADVAPSQAYVLDPDIQAEIHSGQPSEKIPLEIERKFLINRADIPEDFLSKADQFQIVQTYISYSPEVRVRRIDHNGSRWYTFTMKLPKDDTGLSRAELEFYISQKVYQDLVKKRVGNTIKKIRYQSEDISVDMYWDDNLSGLIVAEIEFDSIEKAESFQPPKWFGKDITSDKRYKNGRLSQ